MEDTIATFSVDVIDAKLKASKERYISLRKMESDLKEEEIQEYISLRRQLGALKTNLLPEEANEYERLRAKPWSKRTKEETSRWDKLNEILFLTRPIEAWENGDYSYDICPVARWNGSPNTAHNWREVSKGGFMKRCHPCGGGR